MLAFLHMEVCVLVCSKPDLGRTVIWRHANQGNVDYMGEWMSWGFEISI